MIATPPHRYVGRRQSFEQARAHPYPSPREGILGWGLRPQLPRQTLSAGHRSFTLIEILATIAIMAVLVTVAGFFIVGYVQYSKETADRQTLAVLNDAVNRYKTQGGDVNALTSGTPIGRVISKLQSPVSWAGLSHQFLQSGKTYIGASIYAKGDRHQYHFTRYGAYNSGEGGDASPAESSGPQLGDEGVGFMANSGSDEYWVWGMMCSSGWLAFKSASGTIYYRAQGDEGVNIILPASASYTFWSCAGDGDPTPSGAITMVEITSDFQATPLTQLDVSGLTGLTSLYCSGNQLSSLNVSGLTSLQSLVCSYNPLTALDVSSLSSLQLLNCAGNQLTSLNVSGLSGLQVLGCFGNQLPSLNVSGLTGLTTLYCYGNQLTSLNVSGLTSLQRLYCGSNQLGPINTTGCTSLPAPCTDWSTNFVIDPTATVTGQWTYP